MSTAQEKQKFAQRVALPMLDKLKLTQQRIREWDEFTDGDWYLAYSGGKDSHVLGHIINSMGGRFKRVPMFFSNTGLEFPEIVQHVRKHKDLGWNIDERRPKTHFKDVWEKEGIPLVSKQQAKGIRVLQGGCTPKTANMFKLFDEGINSKGHLAPRWKVAQKWRGLAASDIKVSEKCCDYLKKKPAKEYMTETGLACMTGMMAGEGGFRGGMTQCNMYDQKEPKSNPMLFWTEGDVWEYIKAFDVEICSVYYPRVYNDHGELLACDSPHVDLPSVDEWESDQDETMSLNVDGSDIGQWWRKHTDSYGDHYYSISGEFRTGCTFCGFGAHLEKGSNRFQRLKVSHPRMWRVIAERMGMGAALETINVKVTF